MRRKLFFSFVALLAVLPFSAAGPPAGDPVLHQCLVALINESQLSCREPGVLMSLEAKEGMQVKKGMSLGHLDDSEPMVQNKIKNFEHNVALEQAKSTVDVDFAKASTKVSEAELEKDIKSNQKVPDSVTDVEVKRAELTVTKSKLSIEKAQMDRRIAALTSKVKAAEVEATDLAIKRRVLTAPFDGVVVNIYRHLGEWVAPADPVLRIVHLEHLRIEGALNAADFSPDEIRGCAVTVDVALARGRHVKLPGKIIFVSPIVEAGGDYTVWAEVKNHAIDNTGEWLLRPGLYADMTIHLNKAVMNQVGAAQPVKN